MTTLSAKKKKVTVTSVKKLLNDGWKVNRGNPTKSWKLGNSALEDAKALEDIELQGRAHTLIGTSEIWRGNYKNAFVELFEGLQLSKDVSDYETQTNALYYISTTYYFLGNHDSQLEYAQEAYNIAKSHNLVREEAAALNILGTGYYATDNNTEAIKVLKEALEICEKNDFKELKSRVVDGLGESYYNKADYKQALEFKERCKSMAEEAGAQPNISYALDGIGCIYAKLHDYDKALKNFKESFRIRKEIGFKSGEIQTIMHIGELFLDAGDYLKAKRYLNRALRAAGKIEARDLMYECHYNLSTLYEHMGDLKRFAHHFKEYHKLKELHYKEQERHKITGLEVHLKMEQIEQEKDVLEEKNKKLKEHVDNIDTLSKIGEELTSTLDIEEVLNTIYERVNSLMDAEIFLIGVHNEEDEVLDMKFIIEKGVRFPNNTIKVKENKLASICFRKQEDIIINNLEKDIKKYYGKKDDGPVEGERPESIIYLPLMAQNKPLGILSVQSFKKNSYDDYKLNILRNLALYAGTAINNARIYGNMETEVKRRTAEVVKQKNQIEKTFENTRLLSKIGQDIISTHNLEDIFSQLQKSVNKLMDATIFSIRILNEEKNTIEYKYTIEKGKKLPPVEVSMNDDDNYSVLCVKQKKEIFIEDHEKDYKKYTSKIVVVVGELPDSLIFCPMMIGDKVIGCISAQSFKKHAYTEYHLDILRTLSSYTAIALENANLVNNLEEDVKARTAEVIQQKEELERTVENTKLLSQIGKDITANLSVDKIISEAYDNINNLMDASVFGIGIYHEDDKNILFSGAIEKGEKLGDFSYSIDDTRVAVQCFKDQKEILINDWTKEYKKYVKENYSAVEGEMPNSMIYLPLTSKDKHIGVVTVQSFGVNAYNEYHLNMLRNLAIHIGIALDNASLYENMEGIVKKRTAEVVRQKEEIEKSYESTRLLGEIGQQITSSLTFEPIFTKVHENLNKLMDASVFGIRVYHPEDGQIEYKYEIEKGKRYEPEFISVEDKNNLSVWCIENKKDIFINDYENDHTNYVEKIALVGGDMPHSVMFSPMVAGDKVVGCITVQSFTRDAYKPYQLDILKTLSSYTAVALENANLYESLEEKVNERTAEVVKQKEEIEQTHKNTELLSEIGNQITSLLSVEDIIDEVYEKLNSLMDASGFGIGLYDKDASKLSFPAYIERGEKYLDASYDMDDDTRLAVYCFKNKADVLINDYMKEAPQYVGKVVNPVAGELPHSVLYQPLWNKQNIVGVITAQSWNKDAYSEYHANLLRNLAVYVAIALENASLYEDMEEKVKARTAEVVKQKEDTETLSQIGKDITACIQIDEIVKRVYQNVNRLMDGTMFGIGYYDDEKKGLTFPGFIENGKEIEGLTFYLDDEDRLAVACFKANQEIFINDYFTEYQKYVKTSLPPIAGEDSGSIIYLPLRRKDGTAVGVITVQSYDINAYSQYHLNLLRSMAVYVAIAIDNATLYENLEDKVRERTAEVVEQKEIIEAKNKHITDSLHYAKRIQTAILPSEITLHKNFEDSFVFYNPKDIVSGDFYWFVKQEGKVIVSAIDCTGHGVPGAFMSLIGYNGLNDVVLTQKTTTPSDILQKLNGIVTERLNQKKEEGVVRDGMDMSLCTIDLKSNMMEFAGAHNSIYLIRNGILQVFKTDKFPVGAFIDDSIQQFTNYEFQLKPGDCLYLFTDGYADQFGGDTEKVRARGGKKFKYSRFEKLLLDIHKKAMHDQHDILMQQFEEWKGELEQLDDVCVIGLRI